MRTPTEVGKYRFGIIHKMMAGELTIEQAVQIQKYEDKELMRLIRKEG